MIYPPNAALEKLSDLVSRRCQRGGSFLQRHIPLTLPIVLLSLIDLLVVLYTLYLIAKLKAADLKSKTFPLHWIAASTRNINASTFSQPTPRLTAHSRAHSATISRLK